MGGSHHHGPGLGPDLTGTGPLHLLPAHCKLAATVLSVFAVVATPREQWWAFALDAAILVAIAVYGRVPWASLARRLRIELPFIAFAFLLPFVGDGPHTDVLGIRLSDAGLWAAWNIVAKGTLGVTATLILTASTPVPHLLVGLERLHAPKVMVAMTSFMIRYGEVVTGEMQRMRIARISRGGDPRWLWQARTVGQSAGALFVRSYERGERVYLAMASRGYAGSMPSREDAARPAWGTCLAVPALAIAVSIAAWMSR